MKTITYTLSSTKCMEEGWTVRPQSPSAKSMEHTQDKFVIEVNPLPLVSKSIWKLQSLRLCLSVVACSSSLVVYFNFLTGLFQEVSIMSRMVGTRIFFHTTLVAGKGLHITEAYPGLCNMKCLRVLLLQFLEWYIFGKQLSIRGIWGGLKDCICKLKLLKLCVEVLYDSKLGLFLVEKANIHGEVLWQQEKISSTPTWWHRNLLVSLLDKKWFSIFFLSNWLQTKQTVVFQMIMIELIHLIR